MMPDPEPIGYGGFQSIRQKILIFGAICLLLTSGIIIGISAFALHQTALATAQGELSRIADAQASQVESDLNVGLYAPRIMKDVLVGVKNDNISISRDAVNAMLREILSDNQEVFGTYVLFEPDAFDGKDAEYVNAPGHDATGRFIPYFTRNFLSSNPRDIVLEPLKDYTIPGPGDWYLIPKQRERETIMNPLRYTVQNRSTLMISFIEPIMINGTFLGITGVDMSLDTIDRIADALSAYDGSARTYILANDGTIAGVTGPVNLIGKNLSLSPEPLHGNPEEIIADIQQGTRFTKISGDYVVSQAPVIIGETDTPWAVQVFVPIRIVTKNATMLVYELCFVSIVCLGCGLLLLSYVARQIADPIVEVAAVAELIAGGDLSRTITGTGSDEVGQLKRSFSRMIHALREKEALEKERSHLYTNLSQKNKELETIVYAASHDLRAPLINIVGFSERLRKHCLAVSDCLSGVELSDEVAREVRPLLTEKIPRSVDFIRTSAKKMDNLVAGLLQLSRIGRTVLQPVDINMDVLMKAVADGYALQIQNTGAEVTIGPLPHCFGDISHINRLFSNILDNALKYRDRDRTLRISVTGTLQEGMAVYIITDTGTGIPAEYLEKIWTLFQRISRDPDVQGEGLGLTIVRRIVEKHGGTISVESEVGTGTSFIVRLPAENITYLRLTIGEENSWISELPPPPL